MTLETSGSILAYMTSGGVAADFDNDGDQDIFVVIGGDLPDVLYINDGTGHFTNKAAAWGVAVKHAGLAAAAGDYDGDGWVDLFVTSCGLEGMPLSPGKHRLYRNTGRGQFVEVAQSAGVQFGSPMTYDGTGAAWGDYDLDGDLDLFIAGWKSNAQGNRLYRNNGNGTFTNATASAGLSLNGIRGFSPRFVDMNGDRWPELLLAADFGTSRYFANNGDGTFTNLTGPSGTGLDGNGMGQTVADFDADGQMDWYVTSIYGPASAGIPGTGNMLYRNVGLHTFEQVAGALGVQNGHWGWGTAAVDLNHDGRIDLLETSGWFAPPIFQNSPSRVWMAAANGTFVDVAASSGLWHTGPGRGLLTLDLENDGDRDVVIFSNKEPMRVFRNDLPAGDTTGWLGLKLDTTGDHRLAPNGVGARVAVATLDQEWVRMVDAGTNFQSQDEGRVHVGIGSAQFVDVRVHWSDGTTTLERSVPRNQYLTVKSGLRGDIDDDGLVGATDLALLLDEWGAIDPTMRADLNADEVIDAVDLALLLSRWTAE
ncbi:MAG: VCBS repeat-containing protein [Phycisphaerae bacterium]|nr:VCBS repeat-containing protein [Phycisphaerae bacterium]